MRFVIQISNSSSPGHDRNQPCVQNMVETNLVTARDSKTGSVIAGNTSLICDDTVTPTQGVVANRRSCRKENGIPTFLTSS